MTGPIAIHPGTESVGLPTQARWAGEDDVVLIGRREVVLQFGGVAARMDLLSGLCQLSVRLVSSAPVAPLFEGSDCSRGWR